MSKPERSYSGLVVFLCLVMTLLIGLTAFVVKLCLELPGKTPEKQPTQSTIQLPNQNAPEPEVTDPPTETTLPQPETVRATATISAQGDILMHGPLFNDKAITKLSDGTWDFSSHFQYLKPYTERYDYALANLETTFGGDDFTYQGWPLFNVPDALAPAMKDAGFDMLLTANNHSYDTLMTGILRTLEVTRAEGMDTLGTRLNEEEKRYTVQEINGIPIGLVCYTFSTSVRNGRPMLNGNAEFENPALVNYFAYNKLDEFYAELEQVLSDMTADGAKASVLFIHWGNEYEIQENNIQSQMAQAICDLGVDVIVGGHPHVVQPMELLTNSADPGKKTVCLYSMGNAISNQRIEEMRLKTGHTEDGVLFEIGFEQYTDGEVYLSHIGVVPTWVNLHKKNGKNEYNILPLVDEERDLWQEQFQLTDSETEDCRLSWQRTMDLVGPGLEETQQWLAQQKQARDAEYLARVR